MNEDWGWIVKQNIAPVWVGEMGSSLNKVDGDVTIAHQKAWADTVLSYLNGTAPSGPRFAKAQQPISGDWWRWGCFPDQTPDGCLDSTGQLNPGQAPYIRQLLFRPKHNN